MNMASIPRYISETTLLVPAILCKHSLSLPDERLVLLTDKIVAHLMASSIDVARIKRHSPRLVPKLFLGERNESNRHVSIERPCPSKKACFEICLHCLIQKDPPAQSTERNLSFAWFRSSICSLMSS